MIYTITLNPAIDKTIVLDQLKLGEVNRSICSRNDIGGKGINVAKVIKNLGYDVCAEGFLGVENKNYVYKKLDQYGIEYNFTEVKGETRTNIKIVEKNSKTFTDINQTGFEVTYEDVDILINNIKNRLKAGDVVVLSGSIPKGVDEDIYKQIMIKLKSCECKVILDADGQVFKRGLEAKPYLIKPNINELKSIMDCDESIESIKEVTADIIKNDIKVVVSMGEKGAVFIDKNNTFFAEAVKVDVKSTVGAGDSMVAALAIGIHENMSCEDMFKLAVASSTAKVTKEGSEAPSKDEILKYIQQIKVYRR